MIALLEALDEERPWTSVTLEPDIDSEKVDILWQYPGRTEAVQVKSSINPFGKADVERWAAELEAWQKADEYRLVLVGTVSPSVSKIGHVGKVAVPPPKNLDLSGLREQAAHRLHRFLESHGLPIESANRLTDLVGLLADDLSSRSVVGQTLWREGLAELLKGWIARAAGSVRIVRVFVSSPDDVAAERAQLDELVANINGVEGDAHQVRLELREWEKDVVDPVQPFDIYLGIVSATLGGGGTETQLRKALRSWQQAGSPWITFYFDAKPELSADPEDALRWVEVCKFRKEVEPLDIVATYAGVRGIKDAFYERVSEHLRKTIHLVAPPRPGVKTPPRPADPTPYLRDLLERTSHIDIRGLQAGTGRANRFPIEQLFISLTTTGASTRRDALVKAHRRRQPDSDENAELAMVQQRAVPLQEALRNDRLVVVGDPGAGKTTFLRRVAHALCQTQLGEVAGAAKERLGVEDRVFPIFVRIGDLAQHLLRESHQTAPPAGDDTPAWLPHYLGAAGEANSWGLDAGFFRQQLESGQCTVLLDGLDEAPDRSLRERLSRLIENVTRTYNACRFAVSSRPAAYTGEVVLSDFAHARIDPLSDDAVATFLSRWCESIYAESEKTAAEHGDELLGAVQARVDIRRMARNPVMLTALAVVHWNERRLPEQRADLYNSIIRWLSRSREQRPGRATADRTVVLLQELALAMQDDPEGRKTQVPKRWAAERLAGEFTDDEPTRKTVTQAERFLDEEEVDSGIIVGRGDELTFWHLTFQEFLAAKATASRLEAEQTEVLFAAPGKIYLPDWREVVLLLAGALHQQGRAKVDWFIGKVLDQLGDSPDLAAQARCAGLVGNILRDLEPLKYKVSDARYHPLLDAVMAVFDRQRFQDVSAEERIAAADALGQAGDPRIDFARDDYWVTIPAGKFLMGAQSADPQKPNYDAEAEDRESPVHEVRLGSFTIARYPLTVGQYEQFVQEGGYKDERWWQDGGFEKFSEPDGWERQVEFPSRPVVGVSWWEAAAYCRWSGHRLPTEAEWERVARGTEGRKYPWGKEKPNENRTNFSSNVGHPTPVGIFPLDVTPEGIFDMGGNVWEWCADWYGEYTGQSVSNPRGPEQATLRVIRSGRRSAGQCTGAQELVNKRPPTLESWHSRSSPFRFRTARRQRPS
ncbi:MAG: SUMF1/EgtB/PvdO family nonheme iron enzyme [Planctomycetes bacterium]|nr:SUMF1/EgtB/PvdO family nonheme iron enzyme [Planctomycetota bacterium]MBL7038848.1 SUMF1/EgtB/PvdO family nonheme iron enzyme [Pirellulaceae bacterium]